MMMMMMMMMINDDDDDDDDDDADADDADDIYIYNMTIIVRPPSLIIFGGLMTTAGTGFLPCNRGHPKFEPWFNPGPGR